MKTNNCLILLLVILIILVIICKKNEMFSSDKTGIVKQPLYHPWIFQNIQYDDQYHSLFDATKNVQGGYVGNLPAQAI